MWFAASLILSNLVRRQLGVLLVQMQFLGTGAPVNLVVELQQCFSGNKATHVKLD